MGYSKFPPTGDSTSDNEYVLSNPQCPIHFFI